VDCVACSIVDVVLQYLVGWNLQHFFPCVMPCLATGVAVFEQFLG